MVASDAENDLAALQVTAADLPYLPLGDSDAVEPGRPVKVLGFPFGRQVEVGKRADAGVVPEVTVTAGSLSAARANEQGETRFLQTDATVNPGNSGGPMLDEDGYVVGVVRMKLARDATSQGAGFSVPVNVVKDFLEASSLLEQLPVSRLRPGVRHTLDWKRVAIELPDGYSDQSTSRVLADAGEVGEIGFRAYRLATGWTVAALEEAILGGREVPGFVPAPATAGRRQTPGRRRAVALRGGKPPERDRLGGGHRCLGPGVPRRVRDRGPSEREGRRAVPRPRRRRRLQPRPDPPLAAEPGGGPDAPRAVAASPGGRDSRARERRRSRRARGESWRRPGGRGSRPRSRPAGGCPRRTTASRRAIPRTTRWCCGRCGGRQAAGAGARPFEACGARRGGRRERRADGEPQYALRFARLGVPIEARGVLVSREGESLLLELEAPVAKLPIVEGLYERWVREVAAGR